MAVQRTADPLRRVIWSQIGRMMLALALLGAVIAWAHEFVLSGLLASLYLNGLIVAVFGLGTVLCFRRVLLVRNDATAFAALREAYDDARRERTETIEDPYWRHYRAMKPGIVFGRPRSIGHMFELAYDELLATRNLRISVVTLQNIIGGIEARLGEERSQLNYLTGLLVFLGLIGTFVGLMEMVGSIGNVISGLNASDGGSSEAMRKLLANLQEPLTGMAMGFSSSLFGLFGSLTLGLLARLGAKAPHSLKCAFEDWLASIAHLDGSKSGEVGDLARLIADNLVGGPSGESGRGGMAPITDVGMVATMAQGFGRMNQGIEALVTLMPKMLEAQQEHTNLSRALLAGMDRLVADIAEVKDNSMSLVAGQAASAELSQEMINLTRTNESRLTSGFNGMAHIMEVTGQSYLEGLRRLTSENYETNARLAKLLDLKAAGDRIAEIAGSIESKVKGGVGTMSTALERTANTIETSMQRITAEQAELRMLLATELRPTQANVSPEFEERLAAGFGEMARSIETMFSAFSTLVNRGMIQQTGEAGTIVPSALPVQPSVALPERAGKQPSRAEIDHDELRRRLYSAAASSLRSGDAA